MGCICVHAIDCKVPLTTIEAGEVSQQVSTYTSLFLARLSLVEEPNFVIRSWKWAVHMCIVKSL